MDRGNIASGVGHGVLILWVAMGDWLFAPADMPAPVVAQVSLISSSEFDKLAAVQPSAPKPAAKPKPKPKPAVEKPKPIQPDPKPEPKPDPKPQPQASDAPPEAPVADVAQPDPVPAADSPVSDTPQPVQVPDSSIKPKPRPINRVAPTPVETPVETPEIADQPTPEVTDQPAPDAPVVTEDKPAAAPQEATTQIVTEAVETDKTAPQLAPTSSPRPQSRPKVAVAAPAEEPAPADQPTDTSATDQAATDQAAIDAALADVAANDTPADTTATDTASDTGAQDVPKGPPMTGGEKDALRVAVQSCWNIGSLSSEALRTTVTVRVDVAESGVPDAASIRMTGSEGGSDVAAKMMFEVARRAIIRCGKGGFPLPADKYGQWKDLELVFDPNGMRMR